MKFLKGLDGILLSVLLSLSTLSVKSSELGDKISQVYWNSRKLMEVPSSRVRFGEDEEDMGIVQGSYRYYPEVFISGTNKKIKAEVSVLKMDFNSPNPLSNKLFVLRYELINDRRVHKNIFVIQDNPLFNTYSDVYVHGYSLSDTDLNFGVIEELKKATGTLLDTILTKQEENFAKNLTNSVRKE